jgi:hypothetical protein
MATFFNRPRRLDDTQELPPPPVRVESRDAQQILTLVRRALLAESLRPGDMRNGPLMDLALDVRSVLMPTEPLPDPVRPSVPVVPGRTTP